MKFSEQVFEQFPIKNIVIPIIVAILTTLIVEYFAKPWLEARKERLIRNRKQIDEVIFQFQKVSGSIAALLPDEHKHPLESRHNDVMLNNAKNGLYGIMEALSRLPHRYIEKHEEHIGKTMLFVGYLLSQVEGAKGSDIRTLSVKNVDYIKDLALNLEYFDVYFLANISSQDTQEKWYRRLFWNCSEKKKSESNVDKILKDHGLEYKK
ncbi:MAG: hypothetical protein ACFNVL_00730 [Candidatus Nanoperiomorbus sp.]